MRVLFALLAAVALAQKKVKKEKAKPKCFGKTDEDQFACMKLDEAACGKDDKCDFGKDRLDSNKEAMEKCMDKKDVKIGTLCDKAGEVDSCQCGMVCHHIDWMQKNVCSGCADMGIKEDCDKAPSSLGCKWIGGESDGAKCIAGRNDCADLKKKDCAKAADKCMYDKKSKKCFKNYEETCSGVKEDTHGKCFEVKTKEECMKVVSMFNKPLCQWGSKKYERETKTMKCMKDVKQSMGKVCESQADCLCGTTCFELDMGFAKMKACNICKDFGIKADCDAGAAGGMGCKWVGEAEKGLCIKKDTCKEMMFEEDKCNASKLCQFKDADCVEKSVTKGTCKSIGKRKKGEPKNDDMVAKAKIECTKIPECRWTEKGKCVFAKAK